MGHPRPPLPRPGGSNPSQVPSVPPSLPPTVSASFYPVTDRKPGRVARSLTSVALLAAVSLRDGLPRSVGATELHCAVAADLADLVDGALFAGHGLLHLATLVATLYSLLLIIRFAPSLPLLPSLLPSLPRSLSLCLSPSPLPPRLSAAAVQCSSSSCSPCYCAEYYVLLRFPPDKIPRFSYRITKIPKIRYFKSVSKSSFIKFHQETQPNSLFLCVSDRPGGQPDKHEAEPAGQPGSCSMTPQNSLRLKWLSRDTNQFSNKTNQHK